ncbi:MAG: hypothetical protein IPH86_02605 [bacterium]|nr:hypothetical protein [bacterium]
MPVRDGNGTRNATCCFEGPVFDAANLPDLGDPSALPCIGGGAA